MSFGKRTYTAAPFAAAEPVKPRRAPISYGGALVMALIVAVPLACCTGHKEPAPKSLYSSCIASAATSADYAYCKANFAGK